MMSGYRIAAVAFTLIAGAAVVGSIWLINGAFRTHSWPLAEGEILYSKVETSGKRVGAHDDRLLWPSHIPDIVYRYHVKGAEYRGDRIYFRDLPTTAREAESMAGLFGKGQRVTLRYNPEDPEESVLMPGASDAMSRTFFGSAFAFFLGVLALRRVTRPHRHDHHRRRS